MEFSLPLYRNKTALFTTLVQCVFRCRIPQCDNAGSDLYNLNWLNFTTPRINDVPSKCTQYHFQGDANYMEYVNKQCREQYFNQSKLVHCHEFVYTNDSLTILNDVNELLGSPLVFMYIQ